MGEVADRIAIDRGRIAKGGKRLCVHWWKEVAVEGVWAYYECRCGRRRADRLYANLMGPLDWRWLNGGDWTPPPTIAPARRPHS